MTRSIVFLIFMFFASHIDVKAQGIALLFKDLTYDISMQGSVATGDNTPLWLNANKYGLSSLETENGYLRASLSRPIDIDAERRWGIGYCLDIVAAYNYTSKAIVQQAFVEGRWLKTILTVGSKQYPMELKNQRLSSGSQVLGINARPVPQVRLALPDYWVIPFTNGWVSLKGHVSYGMTTDDNWQTEFTQCKSKYTQNTLYHSKAGYIKIGNEHRFMPVSLELGFEMATQFGGTSWTPDKNANLVKVENEGGIKGMINAFLPGGSEAVETTYKNISGNQLGSWMMRLNFDYDTWYFRLYGEHFFEDQSSMFHLDYDGYGSGENWNINEKNRFLVYSFKDMLLGVELKLKNATWLNNLVLEYIYTKYQSGPIYHDHTQNISDHIGGNDDYYNNYIFTGWQHWGQVMGNPLYLSPIYNTDGRIEIKNNRFYGFHIGLSGDPSYLLNYRILATWQKGFGRYVDPYDTPRESISALAEVTYSFPEYSDFYGWHVSLSAGMDKGKIHGENYGAQFSIRKTGLFNSKK